MIEFAELLSVATYATPLVKTCAVFAALIGLVGMLLGMGRCRFLTASAARLTSAVDKARRDNASSSSVESLTAVRCPRAFGPVLTRLQALRASPVAAPEDVWQAAVGHLERSEWRWEAFLRSLATTAVLVGLIGTIAGVADLSGGLFHEPATAGRTASAVARPAPTTSEEAARRIPGVFLGTLGGILGTLLASLAGLPLLRRGVDRWLIAVEDAGRLVLLPALPRPPVAIQDLVLDELQRRLDVIARAWEDSLRQPAAALRETAEAAVVATRQVVSTFETIRLGAEDVHAIGQSAVQMREAAQAFTLSADVYTRGAEASARATAELAATLPALADAAAALITQAGRFETVIDTGRVSIERAATDLREGIDALTRQSQSLDNAVRERHEQESRFLAGAERSLEQVAARLASLAESERRVFDQLRAVGDIVATLDERLAHALRDLPDRVTRAFAEAFQQALAAHVAVLADLGEQLRQAAIEMRALLRNAAEQHEQFIALRPTVEGILHQVDSLRASLNDTVTAAQALGQTFRDLAREGVLIRHEDPNVSRLVDVDQRLLDTVTIIERQLLTSLADAAEKATQQLREVNRAVTRLDARQASRNGWLGLFRRR